MSDAREVRRLTFALRAPNTAKAAMTLLHGCRLKAAIEGLVEQIHFPHSARTATAAIAALAGCEDPVVIDSLAWALECEHASVRLASLQALEERQVEHLDAMIERLMLRDPSWLVRRAAVTFLGERRSSFWTSLQASDDPHWRVRNALIQACLKQAPELRSEIEHRLARFPTEGRRAGVLAYLRYRWSGQRDTVIASSFRCLLPQHWDWDVAVLQRDLERLGQDEVRSLIPAMPLLLGHADERIQRIARRALGLHGGPAELAEAIRLFDEPRLGVGDTLRQLLDGLNLNRRDAVAQWIRSLPEPSPSQRSFADGTLDVSEPPRPLGSGHPLSRAAALTVERARELVADPEQETSWHVLSEAARIAQTPLWRIAPAETWKPAQVQDCALEPLTFGAKTSPLTRLLGRHLVCPLGISGHYGLPVEGFVRACEAGVNVLFWEPNYSSLTAFFQRLALPDRQRLHLIAGTFEAEGRRIRRDVERVLRLLRIERLPLLMMFWVQNWKRIDDEVRKALDALRSEGLIADYGLSTHNRVLAVEAMEQGWNPIMVRHSAAHRGAEEQIFPRADELDTSLITFNNTCYSRLLRPHETLEPPSAADCYRYALSMPVRVCLSAPATLEQLDENLAVLRDPELPEERRDEMLQFGAALYEEEKTFHRLVRGL